MNEDDKVLDIIVEELTEAKAKHAVPRRTLIKPDEGEREMMPFRKSAIYRIYFSCILFSDGVIRSCTCACLSTYVFGLLCGYVFPFFG